MQIQPRRQLELMVKERLELERRGFYREAAEIRTDCWRLRGAVEQLESGITPTLL